MPDLLLEIGTEEIPARMIDAAREELARRCTELLTRERLVGANSVEAFSTPRRLTVLVRGVELSQPDVEEQQLGPATKVAYKDGQPTPAAHAFAKKVGVDVSELKTITNAKGEYLAATVAKKGRAAAEVLAEALPKEIAGLYWAKNMYWRAGKPERFVRPVRWIAAMLGEHPLAFEFGGVRAGQHSRGHRILSPGDVHLLCAAQYKQQMTDAHVVADQAEREHRIRKALDAATRTVAGARWREDAALLSTVVNLTEFPGVILGSFDRAFLALPEEVLVTVMRDHQKYFAVEDAAGKLAPHFLAVLNTAPDSDSSAIIRHGNERVLRARFNDAQFFWNTDQKQPLADRVESLKAVTFQKDLGSYGAKTERLVALCSHIADQLASTGINLDRAALERAARLAKTDLTTELVKEFTELQGIVGGLYARAQGWDEKVAQAIYDQYKPESMDDEIPRTIEGCVLSLADKADSIAGMFALDLIPSGSKDPFALRRQANGIVKILAERKLPLSISRLMTNAMEQYLYHPKLQLTAQEVAAFSSQISEELASCAAVSFTAPGDVGIKTGMFFRERLDFYLREVRGFDYDVVNAVLAAGSDHVSDAVARAEAVAQVRGSGDFAAIAVSFKRIKNILRQAEQAGKKRPADFDAGSLKETAEVALVEAVKEFAPRVEELRANGDHKAALAVIAQIRTPLDTFFDKVMVMVDDEKLRGNRLALLATILRSFSTTADFSEIVTEGK